MCYQREPSERIDLPHGYRCEVWPDESPDNPFETWDGMVPMIVEGGRNFRSRDYGDLGSAIFQALGELGSADLERIAATLDGGADIIAEAAETAAIDAEGRPDGYRVARYADLIYQGIRDADPGSGSDRLDYLEALCDGLDWPCLNTCSTGYRQGDYVDVLTAWPPAFGAANRPDATPDDIARELQAAVDLYGAWAWGDVYGAKVFGPDGAEVGSCWGFYGTDHKSSGLLEYAEGEAKAHRASVVRSHAAKLKEWIRNRVPAMYREPLPAC